MAVSMLSLGTFMLHLHSTTLGVCYFYALYVKKATRGWPYKGLTQSGCGGFFRSSRLGGGGGSSSRSAAGFCHQTFNLGFELQRHIRQGFGIFQFAIAL